MPKEEGRARKGVETHHLVGPALLKTGNLQKVGRTYIKKSNLVVILNLHCCVYCGMVYVKQVGNAFAASC